MLPLTYFEGFSVNTFNCSTFPRLRPQPVLFLFSRLYPPPISWWRPQGGWTTICFSPGCFMFWPLHLLPVSHSLPRAREGGKLKSLWSFLLVPPPPPFLTSNSEVWM